MSEISACETPMHDHVRRFWEMLEIETVSITVNLRRDTSSGPYWDGSSFSDAVAKALVADRASLSSADVAEREPVAARRWDKTYPGGQWLYFSGADQDGEKLYLDPPPTSELESENARLRKEQDALIEAAIIAERESCAFAVECHSGFGDPETIEACAQIVRDRCDPALRSDSIHLTPERYAELEAAENRLAEALKALEPFAAVAEHDIGDDETDDDIFWPISNARYSMSGRLRVGHLRTAIRALKEKRT